CHIVGGTAERSWHFADGLAVALSARESCDLRHHRLGYVGTAARCYEFGAQRGAFGYRCKASADVPVRTAWGGECSRPTHLGDEHNGDGAHVSRRRARRKGWRRLRVWRGQGAAGAFRHTARDIAGGAWRRAVCVEAGARRLRATARELRGDLMRA